MRSAWVWCLLGPFISLYSRMAGKGSVSVEVWNLNGHIVHLVNDPERICSAVEHCIIGEHVSARYQCHSVHHKSYMEYSVSEPRLPCCEKPYWSLCLLL